MQPYAAVRFIYAPQYAPADPEDFGGPTYGEQLWLTGRASDALSALLGPDSRCCGRDERGSGGCGQCLLVRNPSATRADWTAVVMKKGRCFPENPGCEAPKLHIDIAAPGYGRFNDSNANKCGDPFRVNTYVTKAESSLCGLWSTSAHDTTGCNCDGLPSSTLEQRILKHGCELFSAWGWTVEDPQLEFKQVRCPDRWGERIGGAFGILGVRPPEEYHLDWSWLGRIVLACGFLVIVGLSIRCWAKHQEKKALAAVREERLKRKTALALSSSSSSSSAGSESE